MSGALKTVTTIAGVVALGATGIGAALGGTLVFAGTAVSVASVATVVSAAASVGAQLTAKDPPRLGSLTDTLLAVNPPQPYLLGRTYFGGVIRHEVGYGPTTNDVPNPLYFRASVFSGGGPLQELESVQVDYRPVSFNGANAEGYYKDYLVVDTQLGLCPEPSALAQNFANAVPQWGSSAKLSGQAAIAYIAVFDKNGDRYASGLPALGAVWKGARCYDMRKDGTLPNGSGSHRQFQEATYEYSTNPAVQAVTYALGRVQNGKLTMGIGIGFSDFQMYGQQVEGIWWEDWAAFANVCDANGWEGGGVVFEGEGAPPRWDNLKDICAAGGGIPVVTGGKLGVVWQAPRVAVDIISAADLTDEPLRKPSSKSIAERVNAITPKFASEAHQWEFVPGAKIVVDEYLAADGGEERNAGETQLNLVNKAKQAAELCTYKLARARERGPIEIPCGPRMRHYRIGTCLQCADDMADYGLAGQKVVVLDRTIDLQTMTVKLTVETETDAKHALALGQTGSAPPVVLGPSAEERDAIAAAVNDSSQALIVGSPTTSIEAKTTGEPTEGELPLIEGFTLFDGGRNVTASATWSVEVQSGTAAVSMNDNLLTVSALDTNAATVRVAALYDGEEIYFDHRITKRIASADINTGSGGTSSSDNTFTSFSSTTYSVVSDPLNITTGSTGEVTLAAPLNMKVSSSAPVGSYTCNLRWQQLVGGTWTDVGTEHASGVCTVEPGGLVVRANARANETLTLTAATDYSFRLTAKANESDGQARFLTGTASASG